jgi:hypothetical protein
MTETHAGLKAYRDQLRDAIARDLERSRAHSRRWRPVRLAVPVLGVAAAAALAVVLSAGAPVQSADAAIIRHVRAALSEPAGAILHEQATVTAGSTTSTYELWVQTDPPHGYRMIKYGHEATGTWGTSYDLAAAFRSLVDAGGATVDSTTTLDGIPAYKLTVSGGDRPFMNGTVYVSRSDYHPLLIDTTVNGGERITFQTYAYLPATTTNLQLLSASTAPATAK